MIIIENDNHPHTEQTVLTHGIADFVTSVRRGKGKSMQHAAAMSSAGNDAGHLA